MEKGTNVYWIEFRDSVHDEMDEFKKMLTPTITTGAKSFQEFLTLFTNEATTKHLRISDIIRKETAYYSDDEFDYKCQYKVGDYADNLVNKILQDKTNSLSVESRADMQKAKNELDLVMRQIVTEDNSFKEPEVLPRPALTLISKRIKERHNEVTSTLLTIEIGLDDDIIVKKLKVKTVEEFNGKEKEKYDAMLKKIDVELPGFYGTQKADNDFGAFIYELKAEATRMGKIKDDGDTSRRYRYYYSDSDTIRQAIEPICGIGSMSAINDLYRTVSEIAELSLEVRKRFRTELARFLIDLGHPLYSIQKTVNIPSSVKNKKAKEEANESTK